ncbi:glycosyl transferase [Rhizobium helianthi]|uniref:Glycosyl transferase n=1 Tax=Rhizobium helianthi TaxID=1132695 RepID=A0ABW4M7D9_9HYPH
MNVSLSAAPKPDQSFIEGLVRARMRTMPVTDLFQLAERLAQKGLRNEAAALYKEWIAYNGDSPFLHLVYFNYSVAVRQSGDLAGSIHALRACVQSQPSFGPGHINLGRAYEDGGQAVLAVQQWRQFVEMTKEITPDQVTHRHGALQHVGRVMENASLLEDAELSLWQAMELRPEKPEAGQHWVAIRQRQCKWPLLTPSDHISLRQLVDSMSPLSLGCFSDDPIFQMAKAYRYNQSLVGRPDTRPFPRKPVKPKVRGRDRLRIGYVSSDLRDHAVGFALREVFELHDKRDVEIYAYYCGDKPSKDETQTRIKAAVDCWRDISALDDVQAARRIAGDDIDVLLDVNGYTKLARTRIFAFRPTPIIVNFCGYPGTMASPFHHYIIADEQIIPPEHEIYYTEKVLRITCNQPLDRKREIAETPTRAEAGLPEDAFVFACFNGMQKITGACFARWMQILAKVQNSVLWLLAGEESVNARLVKLAEDAGISAERIIFAPKAPNAKHLARIALADLFLDTFPYGAHSTGSDAITMGLPILTIRGKSFASRFCASIVNAAGVTETICDTGDEYVAKAIAFGQNPQSLLAIRDRMQAERETSLLRDIPAYTRRLEELCWQMHEEGERGEIPVPNLTNLDVYYEIGADLVTQVTDVENEQAYRQRYLEKLEAWDDFSPLAADGRLWNGRP